MELAASHSPRQAQASDNGTNDRSPRSVQQHASDHAARQRHETDHAADDDNDGDACMSTDESMSSSSSSLDIDDVVAALGDFQVDPFEHQQHQQHQQHQHEIDRSAMLQRSASFSDTYLQQHHHHQLHDPSSGLPRASSFGFLPSHAVATARETAAAEQLHATAEANDSDGAWLLTQFAPAMSKAVHSAEPSDHMDDTSARWRQPWASRTARPAEYLAGVRVAAAQNEVTGMQVRLTSNQAFQVTADRSNWLTAFGHAPRARVHADTSFVPPQLQVEALVVGYVEDEHGDLTMEYLDASRVSSATTLARVHAVYLRLRVGASVRPGAYEIPVRVFTQRAGFTDEQLTWSSCVHVRVADVALPPPRAWRFHLDLWQHLSSIARAHSVALWSDQHFALIERYLRSLAELGQKCITVVATEMPWAGQQCYLETQYPSALFEHALLQVYESPPARGNNNNRGSEGRRGGDVDASRFTLEVDFQHFDRLLQLASKFHMDTEIEVFGLLCVWRDPANGFDTPVTTASPPPAPATTASARGQRRRSSSSAVRGTASDEQSDTPSEFSDANLLGSDDVSGRSPSAGLHHPQASSLDAWRIRCFNRETGAMRYLRRVSDVEHVVRLFHDHCVALGVADRVRVCADEPSNLEHFYEQTRWLQRVAPRFQIKLALNSLAFFNYAPPQVVDYVPLLPLVCADVDATRRLRAQVHDRGGKLCWYVCCSPAFPNQFVSSPLVEGELVGYLTFFLELDGFLRWNFCLWPASPWTNLKWRSPSWRVGDMYFVLPGADGFPVETLRFESLRFAVQTYELLILATDLLSPTALEHLKRDIAQLIWRTTDFAQLCHCDDKSASDIYSLDPADYALARALLLDTLEAARLSTNDRRAASSSARTPPPESFDEHVESH